MVPTFSRLDNYTGIYITRDELRARRVLSNVTHQGQRPIFLFKDGIFEIIFPGLLPEDEAHELNKYAHTVANTDLRPFSLSCFTQGEL